MSREKTEGVWSGGWASFLSNKQIHEQEKYLVLASWTEHAGQVHHAAAYPVIASSAESAVFHVKKHEAARRNVMFAKAEGKVCFQASLVRGVPAGQLEDLLERESKHGCVIM